MGGVKEEKKSEKRKKKYVPFPDKDKKSTQKGNWGE